MATIRTTINSLTKRFKLKKALIQVKRMRDQLTAHKASLFMTFALTSLHKLNSDKSLDAKEFGKQVDEEIENLYARYCDYKHIPA